MTHWSTHKERGASWGLSLMLKLYQLMGPRVTAWLLYPVIGYFYLTSKQSKQASKQYLARVSPEQKLSSFKHFMCFGRAALDKVSVWCGLINHQHLKSYRNPDVLALLEQGKGGVFLCAGRGGRLADCGGGDACSPDRGEEDAGVGRFLWFDPATSSSGRT